MGIDALSLRRCGIHPDERRGLIVHLLKQRVDVREVPADIGIILCLGHILEDGKVFDGLEQHRDELFLELVLELDDFFFLHVVPVLEHLAKLQPFSQFLLVVIEVLIQALIGDQRQERVTGQGSHLQGLVLLLSPHLQVPHIGAHTIVFGMKVTAKLIQRVDDHTGKMSLQVGNLLLALTLGDLLCEVLELALVIQVHILTLTLPVSHDQPECHTGHSHKAVDPETDLLYQRLQ